MRRILVVDGPRVPLVGTLHLPYEGWEACGSGEPALGLVLLNFGQAARAGVADLAARLGDRTAELGVPCFRFDFPGIGDTPGDLPRFDSGMFRLIKSGGHVDLTLDLIRQLRARFPIASFVLGGLCGGAVTALYAANRLSPGAVSGLVLLDPDFSLTPPPDAGGEVSDPNPRSVARRIQRLASRLLVPHYWIRLISGDTRFLNRDWVSRTRVRSLAAWILRRHFLPGTNIALISSFQHLMDDDVPTLVVTPAGTHREAYYTQATRALYGPAMPERLTRRDVDNTNHVFTARGQIRTVVSTVARWLNDLARELDAKPPKSTSGVRPHDDVGRTAHDRPMRA